MITTQIETWRDASVRLFETMEAQTGAMAEAQAHMRAQWRSQMAFWAALNPMLAPWAALAEAFDPDRALVSTPTACGPVRTGPARRRPAAVVKPKTAANAA